MTIYVFPSKQLFKFVIYTVFPKKEPPYFRLELSHFLVDFYSTAALLAMQSAVLATAILSVCTSVRLFVCLLHAGILPR